MKILRDPVHNIIRLDKTAVKLIKTPAFQRLKRIKQLGLANSVFPGGEHTRFSHSVGVYHLAKKLLAQLSERQSTYVHEIEAVSPSVTSAALLHDLGHGPFSHLFENALCDLGVAKNLRNHEEWTIKIIKSNEQINSALDESEGDINDVINVIRGKHPMSFANSIVSSQMDVDRFDYLLRDSMMTGARYGNFDLEWLMHNIGLCPTESIGSRNLKLIFDAKRGVSVLEDFLLGRYFMHLHVYKHKTIRSGELLLIAILRRAGYLVKQGLLKVADRGLWEFDGQLNLINEREQEDSSISTEDVFCKIVKNEEPSVAEYLALDEAVVMGWIRKWSLNPIDPVLADLCQRLVKRDLFRSWVAPTSPHLYADAMSEIKGCLDKKLGEDMSSYYFLVDQVTSSSYDSYDSKTFATASSPEIQCLNCKGEEANLSELSASVRVSGSSELIRWCLPKFCELEQLCEKFSLQRA